MEQFIKEAGWPGRVAVRADGTRVYYIRETRSGKRYQTCTECRTLRAALKEYQLFDNDPLSYVQPSKRTGLVLDERLINDYAAWCRKQRGFEPEQSEPWLQAKRRLLRWWGTQLGGRLDDDGALLAATSSKSLRGGVRLADLTAALRGVPGEKDRIATIKHLFAYLRAEGLIEVAMDPTYATLKVPQVDPEQDTTGEHKGIPEDDYRKVMPLLSLPLQKACALMAGSGCHFTEVIRFIKSGSIEGQVLAFRHKRKHFHRQEVDEATADAARWLKEYGTEGLSRNNGYKRIAAACEEAGVEPWTPGRFRHTFAYAALDRGEDPARVALAVGHKGGPKTLLKFYATHHVAKQVAGSYAS